MIVRQLQNWGAPVVVQEELPTLGYAAIRQQIDKEVAKQCRQRCAIYVSGSVPTS